MLLPNRALAHHLAAMHSVALRVAALGVAAALATGCGATSQRPSPTALGHIRGTFTLTAGPIPTCTSESPCPSGSGFVEAEQHATITVTRSDRTVIGRTVTNAAGAFAMDVPAGIYTVATQQQNEPGRYSEIVTVNPGETVEVSLEVTEP